MKTIGAKIAILLVIAMIVLSAAYVGLIELAARRNSLPAQNELGRWHDLGIWFHPKDGQSAIYWYSLAANSDYPEAQFNLGLLMEDNKNYKTAAYWYLRSALHCYAPAQNNLATFYSKGLVLNKSDEKAADWYKKAADQGNKFAQFSLGLDYVKGTGVEKNSRSAVSYIKLAAEQDYAPAQGYLAILYATGDGVPQDLDLAMHWAKSAKKNGDSNVDKTIVLIEKSKKLDQ